MGSRKDVRFVKPRSNQELAHEWDQLAAHREELISTGRDLSYRNMLLPSLRHLSEPFLEPTAAVLDVGCGTGIFVSELASELVKTEFVAIDPSVVSIDIASKLRPSLPNLSFRAESIEDVAKQPEFIDRFDLVIANMLFQNVSSFHVAVEACATVMRDDAALVFAVPHPCFWPRYYKYDEEPWFHYESELWIEAPFRTSLSTESAPTTTHTHRPLSSYFEGFRASGLTVESIYEPMPDAGIEGVYPIAWEFPRFLLGRCRKPNGIPR